jgi:hypothetical protein
MAIGAGVPPELHAASAAPRANEPRLVLFLTFHSFIVWVTKQRTDLADGSVDCCQLDADTDDPMQARQPRRRQPVVLPKHRHVALVFQRQSPTARGKRLRFLGRGSSTAGRGDKYRLLMPENAPKSDPVGLTESQFRSL